MSKNLLVAILATLMAADTAAKRVFDYSENNDDELRTVIRFIEHPAHGKVFDIKLPYNGRSITYPVFGAHGLEYIADAIFADCSMHRRELGRVYSHYLVRNLPNMVSMLGLTSSDIMKLNVKHLTVEEALNESIFYKSRSFGVVDVDEHQSIMGLKSRDMAEDLAKCLGPSWTVYPAKKKYKSSTVRKKSDMSWYDYDK